MDKKWTSGNELKYLSEVLQNEKQDLSFTNRLEEAFAKKYDMCYAIATNSGTTALHAALVGLGIGKGDEVITTPFTVLVDGTMPIMCGAETVFADVEYDTHNISPESIEDRITEKTKAIIPVSYHGLPYDIDWIREIADDFDLFVIEDDAQAMLGEYYGRYVGRDADISMFSLERTKHVSCGEGGVLLTNDETLARKIRQFAGMGFKNLEADGSVMANVTPFTFQRPDYLRYSTIGMNYRLSEFNSAVALAQFERAEELVNLRREIACEYRKIFVDTPFEPQSTPIGFSNSYFTYAVKTPYYLTKDWIKFYKYHTSHSGDDFYAGMQLIYKEKPLLDLGYGKYAKLCPMAEEIQPRIAQFKTNYRSVEEALQYIRILDKNLHAYLGE